MISPTTRSYSAAFSRDRVVSCKKPITTLIQSRKSRSQRHGVDQSSRITQAVRSSRFGVNASCKSGVSDADGLGNNENVRRARISPVSQVLEESTVILLIKDINVRIPQRQCAFK
jgi:hypothetical protein